MLKARKALEILQLSEVGGVIHLTAGSGFAANVENPYCNSVL